MQATKVPRPPGRGSLTRVSGCPLVEVDSCHWAQTLLSALPVSAALLGTGAQQSGSAGAGPERS